MKQILIIEITTFLAIAGCNMNKNPEQERIKQALGDFNDKDLEPYYESIYKPEAIELQRFEEHFLKSKIDDWMALEILSNSSKEIKADYLNYLMSEHGSIHPEKDDRLSHMEAGHLGHYIVWKFKNNQTDDFDEIFSNAELVIRKGTDSAQNLIVVGFFAAIQNVSSWHKADYYTSFDKWLLPKSNKEWNTLNEFWEGKTNKLT